jgi:hypothetical protein
MLHFNYILNMKKLITPYPHYSERGVIGYYQVESRVRERDSCQYQEWWGHCDRLSLYMYSYAWNESMESGTQGLVLDVREVQTTVDGMYIHHACLQYECTQCWLEVPSGVSDGGVVIHPSDLLRVQNRTSAFNKNTYGHSMVITIK